MTVLLIDVKARKALVRETMALANKEGNAYFKYENANALEIDERVEIDLMLELYNVAADTPIEKVEHRVTAAANLWEVLVTKGKSFNVDIPQEETTDQTVDPKKNAQGARLFKSTNKHPKNGKRKKEPVGSEEVTTIETETKEEENNMAKKTTKKAAKGKKASAKKGAGRKSKIAESKLRSATKDNPLRAGGRVFKSLEIIIKNPGLTGAEFLKKGGNKLDLTNLINSKRVTVS